LDHLEIHINPGKEKGEVEEWWPHLSLLQTEPMKLDEVGTLLENTVPHYLEESRSEAERMKSA